MPPHQLRRPPQLPLSPHQPMHAMPRAAWAIPAWTGRQTPGLRMHLSDPSATSDEICASTHRQASSRSSSSPARACGSHEPSTFVPTAARVADRLAGSGHTLLSRDCWSLRTSTANRCTGRAPLEWASASRSEWSNCSGETLSRAPADADPHPRSEEASAEAGRGASGAAESAAIAPNPLQVCAAKSSSRALVPLKSVVL
eukprot:scaffold51553_cov30-Tisochrysis_lutea.AAC.1